MAVVRLVNERDVSLDYLNLTRKKRSVQLARIRLRAVKNRRVGLVLLAFQLGKLRNPGRILCSPSPDTGHE